jgi:type IV secretory pathway TrbD component
MAKLGFAEIARLINDLDIRKRYCDLAIALLNANISHYRSDATPILVRKADNTAVVVSTLLAAAFIQYLNGIVAALFASAAWYWLAAEISRRRLEQLNIDAEAHNELVAGWAETLRGWEVELVALQTL